MIERPDIHAVFNEGKIYNTKYNFYSYFLYINIVIYFFIYLEYVLIKRKLMKRIRILIVVLLPLLAFGLKVEKVTSLEKKKIQRVVDQIPDSVQLRFDQLFEAWKENWKTNPATMYSSNIGVVRNLEQYAELIQMGDVIIPLIMKKMADDVDRNFLGLQLYDKLQQDASKKVTSLDSEQDKAVKSIKFWVDSIK